MSVPDIQHALDLLRQREIDAAISALEKKVDEIPAHLTAHALLARAYETRGDWTRALRSWENAHFLMPNSPTIRDGKKRVLSRIDEEETRSPARDNAPSQESEAAHDDSTAPPASAPPGETAGETAGETTAATPQSPDAPESVEETETAEENRTMEATQTPEDAAEPAETEEPAEPSGGPASDVARRAQALLSDAPAPAAEPSGAEAPTPKSPDSGDSRSDSSGSDSSGSGDPSRRDADEASSDTGTPAPENDPVEIRTSRRPGTTSFRPDTAIIDAASSLLTQEPTPSADEPASSSSPRDPDPSDSSSSPPSSQASQDEAGSDRAGSDRAGSMPSDLEALRRSAEEEARRGGARPDMSAPSESDGAPDDTVGDLDQLIQDLESARIQPSPDFDDLPPPNLDDDVEDLVSETLARIYGAQSQYREAARIYVKLASQEPANARKFLEQAAEMREKAEAKEAEDRAAEARSSSDR